MIKAGVYTFYSRGKTDIPEIFDFDQLALLTLSVLESRNWFKRLYLFTDNVGMTVLKQTLELPFDLVGLEIENFIPKHLNSFWALAKVKAFSLMYEPFCHIDNDVILYKGLPEKLHKAELIGQSQYFDNLDRYAQYLKYFPSQIQKYLNEKKIRCYNAGLVGGNNWDFYQEVWNIAYETLVHPDNRSALWNVKNAGDSYNQLLEEIYIGILARDKRIEITPLFEDAVTEEEAIKYGYTHLAGDMKREVFWKKRVRDKLLARHEDEYHKLMKNCDKLGIPVKNI
jgi:hypothetical protein